jgi:hypothetical protein
VNYDCDLLVYTTVGSPATADTVRTQGLGGSELELVQIVAELSKSCRAVFALPISLPTEDRGVEYMPVASARGIRTRALLVSRSTPIPADVVADRVVIRATDGPSPAYDVHNWALGRGQAILACVSDWQASLFPFAKKKCVVPVILEGVPRGLCKRSDKRFVYASATSKGWPTTYKFWCSLKRRHPEMSDATLMAVTPGKSGQASWGEGVEIIHGPRTDEYRRLLASAHLFYVPTFSETFGSVAAMTEMAGNRVHICALSGKCGLSEAVTNGRLLTTEPATFERDFLAALREPERDEWYAARPLDRSSATVGKLWLEVLGL